MRSWLAMLEDCTALAESDEWIDGLLGLVDVAGVHRDGWNGLMHVVLSIPFRGQLAGFIARLLLCVPPGKATKDFSHFLIVVVSAASPGDTHRRQSGPHGDKGGLTPRRDDALHGDSSAGDPLFRLRRDDSALRVWLIVQSVLRSCLMPVLSACSGREDKLRASAAAMEFLARGYALLTAGRPGSRKGQVEMDVAKGWCECFRLLSDGARK